MEIKDEDLEALLKYVDLAFPYKKRLMKIAKKYKALLKPCPFEKGEMIWVSGDKDSWFEREFIEMKDGLFLCKALVGRDHEWNYAQRMTKWMTCDGKSVPIIRGKYKFINVLYKDGSMDSAENVRGFKWDSNIIGYQVVR